MTTRPDGPRISGAAVPPHNAEAEESVLGAVMLSADAANEALERLKPEDFYRPAHQSIFDAITRLYDGNQPIDAITVSDALRRTEQLDRVGGVEYLTALLERVPTTSNVDYYAAIVDETSARRRLMRAVEDRAQDLGCVRLMVNNFTSTESFARKFYSKLGFT